MLSPRLKELYVNDEAKSLMIATLMTIADAAVAVWDGGVIGQALSPIVWSKTWILLLAVLSSLSLSGNWVREIYRLRSRSGSWSFDLTPGTANTSIDLGREGDV
jgi:hypothetical protein